MGIQPNHIEKHNQLQRQYFEQNIKRTMQPAGTPYLRRHVDEVMQFAGIAPGQHILEVGCGMGRYTLILAERGVRVEGLDLSPVLLNRLREYDGGRFNIPLHCADVSQPPLELLGAFEGIVGFFTLHHLHGLVACFRAMVQLVQPGGQVVFLEPNPYNPLYYIQIAVTPTMTWQGEGGLVRMRPSLLFRAMEEAGLRCCQLKRFGFFPPFLANHRWGARVEALLERFPLWRSCLPFQIFKGQRPT
jgi:SAM-dependent methyltransferase